MQTASPRLDQWPSIVGHLASLMDLDASARQHRALMRKRGVRSAADLLHLALLYGPGGLSLRGTASHATATGLADLCDVSLLDRLRNANDFLADVLNHLLADRIGSKATPGLSRLCLVDGSTVSAPGSTGSDWRLHARYEPARGCFTDLVITEANTAEALACVAVQSGDVMVCDRGYARVRNFKHATQNGADFITRIGWRSIKLYDPAGQPFDLLGALPHTGAEMVEHMVCIGTSGGTSGGISGGISGATSGGISGDGQQARLILVRKPGEATAQQQTRLRRKASRKGSHTDPRTLRAAGFMMLLTSLPVARADAAAVLAAYRVRWQIELAFKRLKSLSEFAELRANDPKLARSWLLAHLIAAVLIETSLGEDLGAPP